MRFTIATLFVALVFGMASGADPPEDPMDPSHEQRQPRKFYIDWTPIVSRAHVEQSIRGQLYEECDMLFDLLEISPTESLSIACAN